MLRCAGNSCLGKGWNKSGLFVVMLNSVPAASKRERGRGAVARVAGAESPHSLAGTGRYTIDCQTRHGWGVTWRWYRGSR